MFNWFDIIREIVEHITYNTESYKQTERIMQLCFPLAHDIKSLLLVRSRLSIHTQQPLDSCVPFLSVSV